MVNTTANFALQYNIFRSAEQKKMFLDKGRQTSFQKVLRSTQSNIEIAQYKQALPNQKKEMPDIKVQFGKDIVFIISGACEQIYDKSCWLWRDQWSMRSSQLSDNGSTLLLNSPKSNSNSDPQQNSCCKAVKNADFYNEEGDSMEEGLYTQNQVGLLKKQLEFRYKGLLSKSTDSNPTLGIPVVFRFRCKNNSINNCPFLHTLQYYKEMDGEVYYRHLPNCSQHNSDCILDEQNIKYNVIMRKIDSSMHILQTIIRSDPLIKPKQILQLFAKSIGEADQNFLYDGLDSRNVRRSIKKYFDNAVAKVKGKIRQE